MDVDYLLDPNNLILSECSARSSEIESEKVYLKFRSQISYTQIRNDRELGNNFSRNCEEKKSYLQSKSGAIHRMRKKHGNYIGSTAGQADRY